MPGQQNGSAAAAAAEAERLVEIERMLACAELEDAGMNKGGKRQTLVAERLQLLRNLEERRREAKLKELLNDGAVREAVQAMRENLAAPGSLASDFQRRKADLDLLFGTELGREDLANVLWQLLEPAPAARTSGHRRDEASAYGDPSGTASFPNEGFDCLCETVTMALNRMVRASAPICDVFVACTWEATASIAHHVDFPRSSGQTEAPAGVEHFCFPVDPATATLPSSYTIVRTLDDGTRQYGFCKALTPETDSRQPMEVLCLLSRYPWFSLFESVMGPLAEARVSGGYPAAERLLDALFKYARQAFPMPGERFRVPRRRAEDLFLTRPNDEDFPLADAQCCELFRCLGVQGVLAIFQCMMVEGHCVFVSHDFQRLGVCAQAAASLLYPFTWQHIFVPILPRSWIDYITAPMPFICGVHESMLEEVLEQPIEDAMTFAKLDSGEILTVGEAQGTLPQALGAKLEERLTKLHADLKKDRIEGRDFNTGVRDAFVEFMLDVFGHYRACVTSSTDGEFRVDTAKLEESMPDESTKTFLRGVQGSQMFDTWCRERCALKANDYPAVGLFETGVSNREEQMSAKHEFRLKMQANRDVATARLLVKSIGHLRAQNAKIGSATSETVQERVRRHDLWKNGTLWDDMFEDGLENELLVKLHQHAVQVGTKGSRLQPTSTPAKKGRRASVAALQGKGRRASVVALSAMGQSAAAAAMSGHSPTRASLTPTEKEFCDKLAEFADSMMMFGLPLDLVMKFAEKSSEKHFISDMGGIKDAILNDISPRHAHIQQVMKEGWLDVEGSSKWDRRWFAIRGTSLCLYDKHDDDAPQTAFPCGACEVLEPKNQRKGHAAVFRINVAEYAVGSNTSKSGTKSHTSALKFIVDADSTEDRWQWYRAFDNAGATIPPSSKATIDEEHRQLEEAHEQQRLGEARDEAEESLCRATRTRSHTFSGHASPPWEQASPELQEEDEEEEEDDDEEEEEEDALSPVALQRENAKLRAELMAAKLAQTSSSAQAERQLAACTTDRDEAVAAMKGLRLRLEEAETAQAGLADEVQLLRAELAAKQSEVESLRMELTDASVDASEERQGRGSDPAALRAQLCKRQQERETIENLREQVAEQQVSCLSPGVVCN